jgi:hypothetical protein
MSLSRETVEAVLVDLRERLANLTALVEYFERELVVIAKSQADADGAAVPAARRKPGPKPRAASASTLPVKQEAPAITPLLQRKPGRPSNAERAARESQAVASGDAETLRSLRESLGMSQARIGEIAGYKTAEAAKVGIHWMETGKRPVAPGLLDKLRTLLRDKKLGDRGKMPA